MTRKSEIFLKLGSCFDLIKEIPNDSIDLILTDPPYAKQSLLQPLTNVQREILAKEFKRVLKRTGNLVIFCGMYDKWDWYNILSKYFHFIEELVWVYPNPTTIRFVKRKFVPAHDTILWFAKSEKDYYFEPTPPHGLTWFKENCFSGFIRKFSENLPKEKLNTTPKPLAISDILVRKLCPPDGVVLDPFCGTGTFGLSAQKFGCKFIGFEIDREIFNIAKRRLNNLAKYLNSN